MCVCVCVCLCLCLCLCICVRVVCEFQCVSGKSGKNRKKGGYSVLTICLSLTSHSSQNGDAVHSAGSPLPRAPRYRPDSRLSALTDVSLPTTPATGETRPTMSSALTPASATSMDGRFLAASPLLMSPSMTASPLPSPSLSGPIRVGGTLKNRGVGGLATKVHHGGAAAASLTSTGMATVAAVAAAAAAASGVGAGVAAGGNKKHALPVAPEGHYTVSVEDRSGTRAERKVIVFVVPQQMSTVFDPALIDITMVNAIHLIVSSLQPDHPGSLASLYCALKIIGLSPDTFTPVVPIPPVMSTRLACHLPDVLTCILRFDQLIIDDPELSEPDVSDKLKSITAGLILLCTLQRTFPLLFHNVRQSPVVATLSRIFCFVLARPDVAPPDMQEVYLLNLVVVLGLLAECHYPSDLPSSVKAFKDFFEASPVLELCSIILSQGLDDPLVSNGIAAFAVFGDCHRAGKEALMDQLRRANYLDERKKDGKHENKYFNKCSNVRVG